jgi:uncharacterized protein (DUF1330 family)
MTIRRKVILLSAWKISEESPMPKAYWVGCYRKVLDQEALSEYAKVAGPAIIAGGGRFLARGGVTRVFEEGLFERTVLIEFDSVAQAESTYTSAAYQAAFEKIRGKVERDVRIVESVM